MPMIDLDQNLIIFYISCVGYQKHSRVLLPNEHCYQRTHILRHPQGGAALSKIDSGNTSATRQYECVAAPGKAARYVFQEIVIELP